MSDPYLSQIIMLPFNWPPRGYSLCDGQLLTIQQNAALFALLGVQFGGNGTTNFNLPDLRGRVPVHPDDINVNPGSKAGQENVTLGYANLPQHRHTLQAFNAVADTLLPLGAVPAKGKNRKPDSPPQPDSPLYCNTVQNLVQLSPETSGNTGGNGYHNNMQPSVVISFCIAIEGVFPSRN